MTKTSFIFSTDIHGSETCWRKFLNSAKAFKVDALVLSGDMTGKIMVPILRRPDGKYYATFMKEKYVLSESEIPEFSKKVRRVSYLPYVTTPEEADKIAADEGRREKLFEDLEKQVVKYWLDLIPEKVPPNCRVIISPGNDDKLAIDEVIEQHPHAVYGEENVVALDEEHEVACVGWSNPTPWKSPRECSEEELYERMKKVVQQIKNMKTAVFCFHCPPYDSEIDRAPLLDKDLRPIVRAGSHQFGPAGCKATRRIIEEYQPLLGLHGHIHESPGFCQIRRTKCLNPGSEYGEGILKAYLVEIDGDKITRLQRVEG